MATVKVRHPIQPLVQRGGVLRFKKNAIVRFLFDSGPFDMNVIARMPFSNEDREQFAQLIGYSLSGFGELSYVSNKTYAAAGATCRCGLPKRGAGPVPRTTGQTARATKARAAGRRKS